MARAKRLVIICVLCALAFVLLLGIDAHRPDVAGNEAVPNLPARTQPVVWSTVLGSSRQGRPIRMHIFGQRGPVVLIFAGIHGDEQASQYVALYLIDYLLVHPEMYAHRRVAVIPTINPDGILQGTRPNARSVDCNRNFPASDWRLTDTNDKYYGGTEPASEPETRAVMQAIDALKPIHIVSIHVALGIPHCVNFDGPASKLAHIMAQHNGYPVKENMGYPTPGSFGTWAGKERRIPTITLELQEFCPAPNLWEENRDAIIEAIKYTEQPPDTNKKHSPNQKSNQPPSID